MTLDIGPVILCASSITSTSLPIFSLAHSSSLSNNSIRSTRLLGFHDNDILNPINSTPLIVSSIFFNEFRCLLLDSMNLLTAYAILLYMSRYPTFSGRPLVSMNMCGVFNSFNATSISDVLPNLLEPVTTTSGLRLLTASTSSDNSSSRSNRSSLFFLGLGSK